MAEKTHYLGQAVVIDKRCCISRHACGRNGRQQSKGSLWDVNPITDLQADVVAREWRCHLERLNRTVVRIISSGQQLRGVHGAA